MYYEFFNTFECNPQAIPTIKDVMVISTDIEVTNGSRANYNDNHSFTLLLSKSNFFLYDSSDGGSRTVAGPCSW